MEDDKIPGTVHFSSIQNQNQNYGQPQSYNQPQINQPPFNNDVASPIAQQVVDPQKASKLEEKQSFFQKFKQKFDFNYEQKKKILRYTLLIILTISLGANIAFGFFLFQKNGLLSDKQDIVASLQNTINSKSNCPVCPKPTQCPIVTPTPTTVPTPAPTSSTRRSTPARTTTPVQEEVIAPPPPPSD